MTTKAIAMAKAITAEGMTATIEGGQLKLSGGNTERATAMAAAKSLAAVAKAAEGKKGTEQKGQGARAAAAAPEEGKVATPFEVSRFAVALAKLVATGKADACNATLENFRAVAKLVASNPEAFAEA
jgi:ribose/xylose/arabinose/galactoside ABC-type transport system permease subunit